MGSGERKLGNQHGFDLLAVDPHKEEQCGDQTHHLRNGEGPPYSMDITGQAQKISHRHQLDKLPATRVGAHMKGIIQKCL